MPTDAERCQVLCELIDAEPENSRMAETYLRLLWEVVDRQMFVVPSDLHWRPVSSAMMPAAA